MEKTPSKFSLNEEKASLRAALEKKLEPYEKKKKTLYNENESNILKRNQLREQESSLKKRSSVAGGGIFIGIVLGILLIMWGVSEENNYRMAIFIFAGIVIALVIRNIFICITNKKKINDVQNELYPLDRELSAYDKKVKEIEEDIAKLTAETNGKIEYVDKKIKDIDRMKYAKNYIIVFAGARYNGRLDDGVRRDVIIDGYSHGTACPWLIVGLNPGFHTIRVQYYDMGYSGYTNVANFKVDDCSKIYFCKKGDDIYLRTDPLYNFSELDRVLSKVESDEKARFPDPSIL